MKALLTQPQPDYDGSAAMSGETTADDVARRVAEQVPGAGEDGQAGGRSELFEQWDAKERDFDAIVETASAETAKLAPQAQSGKQ